MKAQFTREDLKDYNRRQLISLCEYYGVPTEYSQSIKEIADNLWEKIQPEEDFSGMSVRVSRILKQNRSK